MSYFEIPRAWPFSTVVILGGGPSLTTSQVEAVAAARRRPGGSFVRAIAVNNAYRVAPWADVLYFADEGKFYAWNRDLEAFKNFRGVKIGIDGEGSRQTYGGDPAVRIVRNYGEGPGLAIERDGVRHGWSSGYAAINVAVHYGASRVILLGFDMKKSADGRHHWHNDYPDEHVDPYWRMLPGFETLVGPLTRLGVEVLNATPDSAIACFPRLPLDLALGAVRDRLDVGAVG